MSQQKTFDRGGEVKQQRFNSVRNPRHPSPACLWKTKPGYNSSPPQITQFTYKTFKCNELLRCSRCCKLNTFAPFSIGEEKPAIFPPSMYTNSNSLFPPCTQHGGGDSSRTQISPWGMERWQRCMPRPLLLSGPRKHKHWHSWRQRMWHFLRRDASHLQIDALFEIDGRRCNECALGTQRHATRLLWDLGSGALWLRLIFFPFLFLEHRGPAVCFIKMGLEKMCVLLLSLGDDSLDKSVQF